MLLLTTQSMERAPEVRSPSADLLQTSMMLVVPVGENTVTVLSTGLKPRSTCRGSQGFLSSNSLIHMVYLPGCPCVDLLTGPGIRPPMFCCTRATARPMVAFARHPGPKHP